MTGIPIKGHVNIHKIEDHVKMQVEIGEIYLKLRNTKDCQKTAKVRKRQWWILPWRLQRKHGPADTWILKF